MSSDPTTVGSRNAAGTSTAAAQDGLGFYRVLASFPALSSYRAKLFVVVALGILMPAFLLGLVVVLGAGRLSVLSVLGLILLLAAISLLAMKWAIDRLLAPLDLATQAIDDIAHGRALARVDLPGNDTAAQVLRGVQALVARVATQEASSREAGGRDLQTGLRNRRSAREAAQTLIDERTRRGEEVRAVIVDIDGFRAFNAQHGTGHGDAVLKAVAGRIARFAGSEGIAARWSGDAFLVVFAHAPGEGDDVASVLGRPIVVKGIPEPVTLSMGIAHTTSRTPIDALCAQAETALAAKRVG